MLTWTRRTLSECSQCPLKVLHGSIVRRGATNPKLYPSYALLTSPVAQGHHQTQNVRQARNKSYVLLRSTAPNGVLLMQAALRQSTGNLILAPHTLGWLHSDSDHLPSSQPPNPMHHFSPNQWHVALPNEALARPTSCPNMHRLRELVPFVTQKATLAQFRTFYKLDQATQLLPRLLASYWEPRCTGRTKPSLQSSGQAQ